jgi:hypothetical protein
MKTTYFIGEGGDVYLENTSISVPINKEAKFQVFFFVQPILIRPNYLVHSTSYPISAAHCSHLLQSRPAHPDGRKAGKNQKYCGARWIRTLVSRHQVSRATTAPKIASRYLMKFLLFIVSRTFKLSALIKTTLMV